jgi:hypothetical protein
MMKGNPTDAPQVAYMKGQQAANLMHTIEENPYDPSSNAEQYRQWNNGWMTQRRPGMPEGRPKKT